MCEALNQLTPEPDFVLIDAMPLRYTEAELSLIKGDTKAFRLLQRLSSQRLQEIG